MFELLIKKGDLVMFNIRGQFIGNSVVQNDYLDLVKRKVQFTIIGYSLQFRGKTFPVAMAKSLGVLPTVNNPSALEKVW